MSESDFTIEINFEKGSENPSRVFRSMSELIETFQFLDGSLVKTISNQLESVLILDDIETGSLRSLLRNVLKAVDDEALKKMDWKPAVGKYLVIAKYYIVDFLKEKETIKNSDEVKPLENKILGLAKETDVLWLPAYEPIQRRELIEGIQRLSSNVSHLHKKDKASYITSENKVDFNLDFSLPPESVDDLITKETILSQNEMILKVKKPDYLGESMWEFKHGGRVIPAKIRQVDFLEKFQSQKVDIRPGDSIRAVVRIGHRYDHNGDLTGTGFEIVEIKEIIRVRQPHQTLLEFKPSDQIT